MAQPGSAEYYFEIQLSQHTNPQNTPNQPIPTTSTSQCPPPATTEIPNSNTLTPEEVKIVTKEVEIINSIFFHKKKKKKPDTLETVDLNKAPKDAIEPSYIIETTLFSSFATLKTLYETGKLIRDALFTKSQVPLNNKFPDDPSKIGHIFREKEGHVKDTPENRALIEKVANKRKHYLGGDKDGNTWFAHVDNNNQQIWVRVRNNKITNAGINNNVKKYNPETGLNSPTKPKPDNKVATIMKPHHAMIFSHQFKNEIRHDRKRSLHRYV